MSKNTNNPNHISNRNLLTATGLAVGGVAVALVVAHSRGESSGTNNDASDLINHAQTPSATASSLTPKHNITPGQTKIKIEKATPRVQAETYIESLERNAKIKATMDLAGTKMVSAANTGKIGAFDFFNTETEKSGIGSGNEGWGWLQHNPQYGGSKTQMSVAVYHEADGSFDLKKGVLEVEIGMNDGKHKAVDLSAPDMDSKLLGIDGKTDASYSTSLIETPSLKTQDSDFNNLDNLTAHQLQGIDNEAIKQFTDQMTASGL